MPREAHFVDLDRRYREADWVSEFQRLWAIFNHWLISHYGPGTDRDCVEQIKNDLNLNIWVDNVIVRSAYRRPHRLTDGLAGSYPRFAADNEISRFFRSIELSTTIEPRINRPWRVGSDSRVRITNAITLTESQFIKAYRVHAVILEREIADFDLTIHQTLPSIGVHSSGCCFFRAPVDVSLPVGTGHHAEQMVNEFRSDPDLTKIVNLVDSTAVTPFAYDVIETLYSVRNLAMHESLDFLIESDNAAARAAYDLLDSLIRDIRDKWSSF